MLRGLASPPLFVSSWVNPMHGDPVFEQPENMAVDGAGNVYVADSNHDKVVKFTSEGEVATAWGTTGTHNGQLNRPTGVAADASGHVYVVDQLDSRVQEFSGRFRISSPRVPLSAVRSGSTLADARVGAPRK